MNQLHKAYQVLGLEPGTAFESVKRRYRRLVMVWHPDRMQNDAGRREAEEELKRINHSYDILGNHFENQHTAGATCSCQPTATGHTHQKEPNGSGAQSGNGGGSEQNRNPEEEARRRHEERRRKAEEESRQAAAEAARKAAAQHQAADASKLAAEVILKQAQALKEEQLRWRMAMVAGVALVLMLAFGFLVGAAKNVITDIQHQWDSNHAQSSSGTDSQSPPSVTSGSPPPTADDPDNPYIPQEYRLPGGNPASWRRFMEEEDRKQHQREEEQHKQDVYFTKLAIDRNQKIIDHCSTTIAQLEAKIADPDVSEFEKNKLRDFRDFQQGNLENAQRELTAAQDKLNRLQEQPILTITPPHPAHLYPLDINHSEPIPYDSMAPDLTKQLWENKRNN